MKFYGFVFLGCFLMFSSCGPKPDYPFIPEEAALPYVELRAAKTDSSLQLLQAGSFVSLFEAELTSEAPFRVNALQCVLRSEAVLHRASFSTMLVYLNELPVRVELSEGSDGDLYSQLIQFPTSSPERVSRIWVEAWISGVDSAALGDAFQLSLSSLYLVDSLGRALAFEPRTSISYAAGRRFQIISHDVSVAAVYPLTDVFVGDGDDVVVGAVEVTNDGDFPIRMHSFVFSNEGRESKFSLFSSKMNASFFSLNFLLAESQSGPQFYALSHADSSDAGLISPNSSRIITVVVPKNFSASDQDEVRLSLNPFAVHYEVLDADYGRDLDYDARTRSVVLPIADAVQLGWVRP